MSPFLLNSSEHTVIIILNPLTKYYVILSHNIWLHPFTRKQMTHRVSSRTKAQTTTCTSTNTYMPNALYGVNQPCDWIQPNLRPVDEQGRTVPSFTTSQEAWNWGDAQMMYESSKWYMCGYNRMEGHTNDGKPFYYAYMKSCPTE